MLEPRRGYGQACLTGIAALPDDTEIVVFLDGDYSDYPAEMDRIVEPLRSGAADLVIGSRVLGKHEAGALLPQARWGNALACALVALLLRLSPVSFRRAVSGGVYRVCGTERAIPELDLPRRPIYMVKERILEHLAVASLVEKMRGPILCLVGPPGVGKVSAVR